MLDERHKPYAIEIIAPIILDEIKRLKNRRLFIFDIEEKINFARKKADKLEKVLEAICCSYNAQNFTFIEVLTMRPIPNCYWTLNGLLQEVLIDLWHKKGISGISVGQNTSSFKRVFNKLVMLGYLKKADKKLLFIPLIGKSNIKSIRAIFSIYNFSPSESINTQGNYGRTLLILAASFHMSRVIMELIEKGADLNIQNRLGETALMCAVSNKPDPVVVREFIKHNAKLDIQDRTGRTILIHAIEHFFKIIYYKDSFSPHGLHSDNEIDNAYNAIVELVTHNAAAYIPDNSGNSAFDYVFPDRKHNYLYDGHKYLYDNRRGIAENLHVGRKKVVALLIKYCKDEATKLAWLNKIYEWAVHMEDHDTIRCIEKNEIERNIRVLLKISDTKKFANGKSIPSELIIHIAGFTGIHINDENEEKEEERCHKLSISAYKHYGFLQTLSKPSAIDASQGLSCYRPIN